MIVRGDDVMCNDDVMMVIEDEGVSECLCKKNSTLIYNYRMIFFLLIVLWS